METNILLMIQILNIAILVLWPILSIIALFKMRTIDSFTDWVRIVWVLIIIIIPVLGSVAFLIATPAKQFKQK